MMNPTDASRRRVLDLALLVLRIGIGISFVFVYGSAKIFGGPESWADLGDKMAIFGITFAPAFWGFMAALSEFGGGILLMLGFLFRPALAFMLATMFVASMGHITGMVSGGPWHAIEMGTVFIVLLMLGPGAYSVDAWLWGTPSTEPVSEPSATPHQARG